MTRCSSKQIAGNSRFLRSAATIALNVVPIDGAPEVINTDPYGEGWLYKVRVSAENPLEGLLTPEEYRKITQA